MCFEEARAEFPEQEAEEAFPGKLIFHHCSCSFSRVSVHCGNDLNVFLGAVYRAWRGINVQI